ncbi:MAG: PfkB family carbohydrate kinase [Verrucomicrobiia bacterium]|jgi:rfaE bifunctional protein kinase chain/domain
MNRQRFNDITALYSRIRIAIVGDFCLDRYLEIDPARSETSLETGLAVHNVVSVRSQPGAAGTILSNLVALGIGEIFPVGFCGNDGEGFELRRELQAKAGVKLDHFLQTGERRTFTYCKPLVVERGKKPVELNRLDSKNWTPTPAGVQDQLIKSVRALAENADAIILMDQVDMAETGVVTSKLLDVIAEIAAKRPGLLIIADSRRGLKGYPPVTFKMNAAELSALTGAANKLAIEEIELLAGSVARRHGRSVFVTLAERGLLGATPTGQVAHVPALPVRGPIDIVGAGDSVTANLTASLAAGATLRESLEMAAIASSVVIHQLGTTGVATVADIGAFV